MKFEDFQFGRIRVDGTVYDYDLIIDRGKIRKRKKSCRRSTASPLVTRRFQWKRQYRGIVLSWSLAPEWVHCL